MVKKEKLKVVIEAIADGLPIMAACRLGNVSKQTFYRRLEKDSKFREQIELAEVRFMESRLKIIDMAAEKNWPAAAWRLERRFPAHFSLKNRDGKEEKSITVNIYGIFRQGKNGNGKALPSNGKRITNGKHKFKD